MHSNIPVAFFTIAKMWKQANWLLTAEWIEKMSCIHKHKHIYTHTHTHTNMMEYYSVIKMSEIMPFSAT